MIKDSFAEDEKQRREKISQKLQYQRELDTQLNITRNRSLKALTETMSEKERSLNAGLIKKTVEILSSS